MTLRLRAGLLGLFACGLLAAVSGCGGRVAAKGQIKEDGKSLIISEEKQQPSLQLISDADSTKSYAGNINKEDGTFEVKDVGGAGIPPGKYKVVFDHRIPYPMGKDRYEGRYSATNSKLFVDVTGAPLEINLTTK